MSAFAEFLCVAIALFVWESLLWLPLRGTALRKRWFGGTWKVLDPAALFATRELGVIPMLIPPDAGLAPCQGPPLAILGTDGGGILVEYGSGRLFHHKSLTWNDLHIDHLHLVVAGVKTRISSPRCMDLLRWAKLRGATVETAVQQSWRLALSPTRAGQEWRRWILVSRTLRWNGFALMLGFFAGLPLVYLYQGGGPTLMFGLWLWCLMAWTAGHLWWLGGKVYPGARSDLRMDALLALLVPFHAIRATEIASVHAMGTTHPISMLLSTKDLQNPWLGSFVRRVIHPLPGSPEDIGYANGLRPLLVKPLSSVGKRLEDFDLPPDHTKDPAASLYCPRCHGLFLDHVQTCPDCAGIELRCFDEGV